MPTPLSTIRVTPQGLDDFLTEGPTAFPPGPDTYEVFQNDMIGRPHVHRNGEEETFHLNDEGLSTGGDHVGRDLGNKQQPLHPLDDAGPNPYGDRRFYGDEFQGMLTFDREGAPTFHSRFPEAESAQDITELRINIASVLPDYMTGDTPQAEEMEAMENDAFEGLSLEDVFAKVDDKMVAAIERYAQEFEQAYGIKMTVGVDLPDPHLSLMGYTKGDPNLLGFASFPPGINDWEELRGLGAHQGYMVMNNQYTDTASEKDVYDLFVHEFGHTLGMAHPHDLALLNMSKREALTATKMAYTDLKLRAFQHVVTDAEGEPVLDDDGNKQYVSAGPDEGVLDLGFRKWVPHPGTLDHAEQPDPSKPGYDGYKAVYDLDEHNALARKENAHSIVYQRERLLPMVPMINDGKHTVLKGTPGDDYLDTNPGYASTIKVNGSRAKQQFVLVEGHMEKVMGISGNNIIVAAQHGDQEILPGTGENTIRMLYPDMKGHKRIHSEGQDTLVLTEELLNSQRFSAEAAQDGIALKAEESSINLEGGGLKAIEIVNSLGQTLVSLDVQGKSAQELNDTLFNGNSWKQLLDKEPEKKADPADGPPPKSRDTQPPDIVVKNHEKESTRNSPWLDRLQMQAQDRRKSQGPGL